MSVATLRPLAPEDLERIRAWRNAPGVREASFQRHEVGADEHRAWFERASVDATRRLWLFERDGHPAGFVQFSGVAREGVAEWGFYAAPDAPRGTGRQLCRAALQRVFGEERVHKVCGRTLHGNLASHRLHVALGFHEEGVLREHHHDGTAWRDVHCFGLLRREWALLSSPETR
ncbi:MAG TPA: UDP-4-amino-4,6-dideoxy-N-acetyl-beta-L-altrosamine N-acetyltransferase [Burkholderiaceae bacterium]|nr:UDP-4-amino-4,6-dideoxy-N-acetyl-beta-L-altrosamine N-acetyltransferase [Burkholderiaceae bacterium]